MQSLYYRAFNFLDNSKPIKSGIYFSLFLHLIILLFAIGLPDFFKPKKISVPQIIPIEILNISDVTSLKPIKENIEIDKKQSKKMKQKKFSSSENLEIQNIELREKPEKKNISKNISENNTIIQKSELTKNPLKEKKINRLKEEKVLTLDNVETPKVNKIKPKIKPKTIERVETKNDIDIKNKIKPKTSQEEDKKIIDKPKPIQKPDPDLNLATMLKDLRNEDTTNVSDNKIQENNKLEESEEEKIEDVNIEISISEIDLVIQQLRRCFNPRAGTKFKGDEMIKISAKVDKQTYVRTDTVQIVDTNISKSNPYYEAITESALAIFYNPLCAKLKLPINKYDEWKNLTINVDYSWMKN